jgi:hypothetical protein
MNHCDANVRSPSFYVAQMTVCCGHCAAETRVIGLVMPPGHETLDPEAADGAVWQRSTANALLSYVAYLPDGISRRLCRFAPTFRLVPSPTSLNAYWTNHCEHCDLPLGDHELHCEPGVFMPLSARGAMNIQLFQVLEAIAAVAAGYAADPEFFEWMAKAPSRGNLFP